MVARKEIKASNARISDATGPSVAVFVGGTSGVGQATIKALVATGMGIRIYLIGRKTNEHRMHNFIDQLSTINSKAEIIWIAGEVSLLAETKRICEIIKAKEPLLDLLFLSTGYAPFGGRQDTSEGIDVAMSLGYYTRVMFISCLLPLLANAEAPRVVSVLGGGLERKNIEFDDPDLKMPGKFGGVKVQMQCVTMNSAALEVLSDQYPNITFIHSWPGWVNTGNARRGTAPNSALAWAMWLILEPIIYLFGYSHEVSGQMHLFQCTSAVYGGHGNPCKADAGVNTYGKPTNGLFLVNYTCDCTPNAKVMPDLRQNGRDKLWNHTQAVLQPYK